MTLNPPETIKISEPVIACDGGGGALGHPRVYLHLKGNSEVECPYCDRLYILDKDAKNSASAHP